MGITKREYYGLDSFANDVLAMHSLTVPVDSSWDDIVPQSVIDEDNKKRAEALKLEQERERKFKLAYEKDCKEFSIPTCPICHIQYDPFSQHSCVTGIGMK